MTNKVLSVLKGCISHIQLKLSDFSKGDPEPGKIITERFTERTQPHNINERLVLLPGNHFDLVNPVCPFCGSDHGTCLANHKITQIFTRDLFHICLKLVSAPD